MQMEVQKRLHEQLEVYVEKRSYSGVDWIVSKSRACCFQTGVYVRGSLVF
jgi:hypothetical protein